MKDFAKSIVCNSVTEKEFNTEADLRRWCIEHQYAYTPTHGGYYRLEDDKPGRNRPDLYAHVKAGNKKVGNGINVQPVTPSQKPGTKPQSAPDTKKKDEKEETTDKNGRTFREVLEEVKKTGNKYNIKPMSYKADAYRYGKELAEQDFKNFKYSNTSTLESIYRNNTSGEDYEQYGFLDFKKGYYDTYQQMDKKVGNVSSEYEILKQDPSKMHPMYKKAYEEAMKKLSREDEEFKKRFEKEYGVKAKNEASDDKFAYVMREFEEGKLKTPDGKVVTDPAQAKAIAYSESKKTENGLARARNAIKKNS